MKQWKCDEGMPDEDLFYIQHGEDISYLLVTWKDKSITELSSEKGEF